MPKLGRLRRLAIIAAFGIAGPSLAQTVQKAAPALKPLAASAAPRPAQEAGPVSSGRQIFGLETPMRDGTKLVSDVWLPPGPGPFPTIVVRTPYVRTEPSLGFAATATFFTRHGYAYVVQDVRGRGDSGGEFRFLGQEPEDGYDTIENLATQPWSDGRIGMMGVSYLASVQWLAAKEKPPHLVCIAPTSPGGNILDEVPATGGAFMMEWALNWLNGTSGHVNQASNAAATDMQRVYAHRPLLTMDEALGRKIKLYREFLSHDTLDAYWRGATLTGADFAKIDLPVMVTTGWFDGDQNGALFFWNGMHQRSAGAPNEYLTIGPWLHPQSYFGGAESLGKLIFGKASILDNNARHLAFFDRYLQQSTRTLDFPNVHVFVTGVNVWRDFDAWPVPSAQTRRFYLASGGSANTDQGNGRLDAVAVPSGQAAADGYTYDPKAPVPLDISDKSFATDRNDVQSRHDVLVYTSPVLSKTLEVIGPVMVQLYASSDARDTDFTASIQDVQPNGDAVMLGSRPVGIVRARYRGGPAATPALLTPGKPELYQIQLGTLGHAFLPQHRIRLDISSSASPMFNPNQNTGNPIATDTDWQVAHQQILHDPAHPSALVLAVVEPK